MKRWSEEFEDRACCNKGKEVSIDQTGDDECNAYDTTYECGGTWHNNFMDIVGNRTHDCWWDCPFESKRCKERRGEEPDDV